MFSKALLRQINSHCKEREGLAACANRFLEKTVTLFTAQLSRKPLNTLYLYKPIASSVFSFSVIVDHFTSIVNVQHIDLNAHDKIYLGDLYCQSAVF